MKDHLRTIRDEALWNSNRESKMTCHWNVPIELKTVFGKKQDRYNKLGVAYDVLVERLKAQFGELGAVENQQFEDKLAAEMKENGYLLRSQSLQDSFIWLGASTLFYGNGDD